MSSGVLGAGPRVVEMDVKGEPGSHDNQHARRLRPVPCENPLCKKLVKPYQRNGARQRFCNPTCWAIYRRERQIKVPFNIGPANAARIRARRERMARHFRQKFGALSMRELEIIRMALAEGYNVGYWKAWTRVRRESAA